MDYESMILARQEAIELAEDDPDSLEELFPGTLDELDKLSIWGEIK